MLSVPEDLRALGVTDIVAIDTEFVHRRGERVTPYIRRCNVALSRVWWQQQSSTASRSVSQSMKI